MAEVKGKFIMLAGSLMTLYKDGLAEANKGLVAKTGKTFSELEPEGWYDTSLFNLFMETYARYSVSGDRAIVTLGRNVYPTIKKSAGLPPHLKTPLDFIKFEAEGFLANHRGSDVQHESLSPRRTAMSLYKLLHQAIILNFMKAYSLVFWR
ncbi:MAG: hypothetical protein JNN25_04090 [Candidatus Kapabacteria bacterium]|nr:hypothetical protein [Candidatus Kapabacteria bacterium]